MEKTFNQNDIDELISSNKEESINLEFKRSDALKMTDSSKNEIAKDVSAFANSDGGIIIYGIQEIDHKASNYSYIDGNLFTKEWLDQVISSRIQRRIEGLIIDPIRIGEKIDQSIYVVKIPRSYNTPHMTSNKKYYKRHNFQSIEMEEYEIRDLYSRHSKTKLSICEPTFNLIPRMTAEGKHIELGMIIAINIENLGNIIEKDFKLEIGIPRQINSVSSTHGPILPGIIRNENDYSIFNVPNPSPIFQNERTCLCKLNLKITKDSINDFLSKKIILSLFYTYGFEKKEINLSENMIFNDKLLDLSDFG